jgi:hypothetical protein
MEDHDQRFKILLREFFIEFIRLFFPDWADRFDFSRIEWLEKEVFLDPPRGKRRVLDLVAKLPAVQPASPVHEPAEDNSWLVLIHIEIESADSVVPLRSTMFTLYQQLRNRHGIPVLPIGFYLQVGLDGVGWDVYEEHFWEHCLIHFEFAYVGLPALDGERYLEGENVLGVALAALMRLPEERKEELAWRAVRRALECKENDYRRFLLQECVTAYLPLRAEHDRERERLLDSEPQQGVRAMATSFLQEKIQQGVLQGVLQGQRQMLQMQLEKRFGPLSPRVREHLQSATPERLAELGLAIITAQTLRELGLEE